MREDKQKICDLLCQTLKATWDANDVVSLRYVDELTDKGLEHVIVTFESGGVRLINVSMDSGVAMIRDIMKNLGV